MLFGLLILIFIVVAAAHVLRKGQAEAIVTIGYQTPTSQIWSALVMKNRGMIEKRLAQRGPVKIQWQDFSSGPPITNNMISRKVDIGFMGDMPLLINASKGQNMPDYRSTIIAMDGKGREGKNQAIMTSTESGLTQVNDLRGKRISTIFGSSAHRMLLSVLEKYALLESVELVHQDVSTGMSAVEQNKIDAHATWDPYPRFMKMRGHAAYIVDGSESKVDYLDGIVVRNEFLQRNNEFIMAFLQALIDAHAFIRENPEAAARIFNEESKFPFEVCLAEAREIRWDAAIYERDLETLRMDYKFLQSLGKIEGLDVMKAVDDGFLRKAVQAMGRQFPTREDLKKDWMMEGL